MENNTAIDIVDLVLQPVIDNKFTAKITIEMEGILAGSKHVEDRLKEIGLEIEFLAKDGERVNPGDMIAKFSGGPKQLTAAENVIMGKMAKASGIATATNRAVTASEGKISIVSGSWKKMPEEIKGLIREAVSIGGGDFRICEPPFMYLDKNYVKIFGSISETLKAASVLREHTKVIQLRGVEKSIKEETIEALEGGANVLMVDTGKVEDAIECIQTLESTNSRNKVKVAYSGGVKIKDVPEYVKLGIDTLCIGKQIVDAPLLDMKMDIL
ncbi:hypothetical protein [Clostridium magnum]|uniref:Putative nicotinate-nucleotide pyrophosphorylase n=1 Tax=Clostridium magnum DSM 2767 TaxID=1121326 RepID=A0A161XGA4_9CLOT|nr:hypothetical protein [Clostridium magnum]KZL93616.1 putative nicotinate-nucleotide pyrophosphorylase [Clostridium magnum DSM 2767]SHI57684.1 nicotinate-nucleotide pyrophosphorylase (carboxylating) [Clostridium magnum DSM 2767]